MRCSHSVHPGNASNIRTTARIGCPTATLSPPPNVKESGSSRGRMRVDFIHSHHHTSSQYQRNKKKAQEIWQVGINARRDEVFMMMSKPID